MPNRYFVARTALIVALGGFLMGFDASVISGVVGFIEPQFALTKIQLGWAVSCLTLTATLGMMVSGPLSDAWGRRKVLLAAAVVYAISAVTSAIAPTFWFLVMARMLGGFGVGASLIVAPMYIAELSPPAVRGRMVSINQLNIVIGISAAFFSNYLVLKLGQSDLGWARTLGLGVYNWRWMLGLESLPAVFYFAFLFVVPESPRWLMMRGQEAGARAVLEKACGPVETEKQINDIQSSIATDAKKERTPLTDLFVPAMRLVLTIGVVIAIVQQITGINAVFFYAPMIFEQSGIGTDASFSQAVLVGLINLVFTIVAIGLIDRLGRKPLLGVGLTGITVCMFLLAYGFHAATFALPEDALATLPEGVSADQFSGMKGRVFQSDREFKDALVQAVGAETALKVESDLLKAAIHVNPRLILFGILGFVASFAVSLGPVMWVLFSELFPNRLRGVAISFVGFINSGVSFLVQLVFPWELATLGSAGTFLIYGVFAAVGLVFVLVWLPETKGRSLEMLEAALVKTGAKGGLAVATWLALGGGADGALMAAPPNGPVPVVVKQVDGRYELHRDGRPYRIRGAGLEFGSVEKLAEHGGNSFRTWRTENGRESGQKVLDRALRNGLTVTMGIEMGSERHGFDYNDAAAVARQFERVKGEVLRYRDHPALLMWAIGNELNLSAKNHRVWNAVNEVARMIHEVDPHHPATTTLAGINSDLIRQIAQRAPDLDLLCVQMYADIVNLPRYLKEIDWSGPYVVSEWGATGHWEVGKTPWGAPIENTSSVKADLYLRRYRQVIEADTQRCLGSYVFLWGQKQERTPTWYGLFLESGEETEAVDVMHFIWNGQWPANRSPRLESFRLNGLQAEDAIKLARGQTSEAAAVVRDPDGDPVTCRWDVKPESTDLKSGGDFETTPPSLPGLVKPAGAAKVTLTAPDKPGPYRLFVYAFDGHGHAAHANIPFLVVE